MTKSLTFNHLLKVPGKLILWGEYSVLEKYPAAVQAIDRYFYLDFVNQSTEVLYWRVQPMAPEWQRIDLPVSVQQSLVDFILKTFESWEEQSFPGGQWDGDLSGFFLQGQKLGLGSSAASTIGYLMALNPSWDRKDLWKRAFEVHRAFQGGRGSGIDIAASLYGGMLKYRLSEDHEAVIEKISLPKGMGWKAYWVGCSSSTSDILARLEKRKEVDPLSYERLLKDFGILSQQLFETLGQAQEWLNALSRVEALYRELGEFLDFPLLTEAHLSLSQKARAQGLVCKPSGAGGGDISLVLGPQEALESFNPPPGITDLNIHPTTEGAAYIESPQIIHRV